MDENKIIEVQRKQAIKAKEEKTIPGQYYMPYTDIYETTESLEVVMEIPGVDKKDVHINLDNNMISIECTVDLEKYKNYKPVYTEYNIGNFSRSFTLSSEIDKAAIQAKVEDGVLRLVLPKLAKAIPRKIQIS